MGQRARGNTTVTFDSNNITQYCTSADLDRAIDRLETTNLASTGATSIAGDETNSIKLQGNWRKAIDDILGPKVGNGTKYTAVIAYADGAATVTYTYTASTTNGAEIENYSIASPANGLRTFTCDLMLSGAPVRSVA